MDLLDEAPDEDQLEPIERALQEAEKAIDALRSKKAWAGQIYRFMGRLQVYRSDYAEAARIMEKGLTYLSKDTELIARVAHVLRLGGISMVPSRRGSVCWRSTLVTKAGS